MSSRARQCSYTKHNRVHGGLTIDVHGPTWAVPLRRKTVETSVAFWLLVGSAGCFVDSTPDSEAVPETPVTEETGGPGSSGDDCVEGTPGCRCEDETRCEPGNVCTVGVCVPDDCVNGRLGCPCSGGECLDNLVCATQKICVEEEPVDMPEATDTGAGSSTGPGDACEAPATEAEDCNGNGVLDLCDEKVAGGTCVLSSYVDDAIEAGAADVDLQFAFVRGDGETLSVGVAADRPLVPNAGDPNVVRWHFDVDADASTGSGPSGRFGSDANVRLLVNAGGATAVRVDGSPVPAEVEFSDYLRAVTVHVEPSGALDTPRLSGRWVATSGANGGPFAPGNDVTPITFIESFEPVAEDCDDDGWFDACGDASDEIGFGFAGGDGVPDHCQADRDGNGIDDSCQ